MISFLAYKVALCVNGGAPDESQGLGIALATVIGQSRGGILLSLMAAGSLWEDSLNGNSKEMDSRNNWLTIKCTYFDHVKKKKEMTG